MTLHRLPRSLPAAGALLADLGHPTADAIGAALGVSQRTVWRWRAGEDAGWPRPALLGLFFASRWGWSAVESEAFYRVQLAEALAASRADELQALRAQLVHVQSLGDFGAANAPLLRA